MHKARWRIRRSPPATVHSATTLNLTTVVARARDVGWMEKRMIPGLGWFEVY